MPDLEREEQVKKVADLIRGIKFAMLTTVAKDGSLRSRPMTTQDEDFDGDLRFFTRADATPFLESVDHPSVNVSFSNPDANAFVSASGTATVERDQETLKRYWKPAYKVFFPQGLDDPELVMLKIEVSEVEYWDSPHSKLTRAFNFARAYVPKDPSKLGTHVTVGMK
jgi:general stress protein 26